MVFSQPVFDGITLSTIDLQVRRVIGTIKQAVGNTLVKMVVPGRTLMDYEITIKGLLVGVNAGTNRTTLQTDFQARSVKAYTDGLHDGNYIIDQLSFNDSGERPEVYDFTIQLIQFNQ